MKELLAMLMSLFISMFENVDYQHVTPPDFTHDTYYKVQTEEPIDYRDLYGKAQANASESNCVETNQRVTKCFEVDNPDPNARFTGTWLEGGVWLEDGVDSIPESSKYTFTTSCKIASPFNGKLRSYSIGNNGRDMIVTYDIGDYNVTLHFENMERWWCCMYKTVHDGDTEDTWKHTFTEDVIGHTFEEGHCLGMATEGETTVTVSCVDDDGNKVDNFTLKSLYSQ